VFIAEGKSVNINLMLDLELLNIWSLTPLPPPTLPERNISLAIHYYSSAVDFS
jgi:hypothetical protein